jgi:hypothetical protein
MTKKLIYNAETNTSELVDLTTEQQTAYDNNIISWNNGALDRALTRLRETRNQLLKKTDWMANSDVTMSDDWKTYRQALRDLTNGLDTVEKVETKKFPTKPSGE